jgi:DNA-binding NtrC family response regulator
MVVPDPADPPAPENTVRANVVLIVEDEILIRLAIADHLRDAGFRVFEAANGLEAVDLLSHYCHEIDAVFSDVMMPGPIDGAALISWIATNCPSVPVVLTSGAPGTSPEVAGVIAAGLFFLKPYDIDKVAAVIIEKAKARALERDTGSTP